MPFLTQIIYKKDFIENYYEMMRFWDIEEIKKKQHRKIIMKNINDTYLLPKLYISCAIVTLPPLVYLCIRNLSIEFPPFVPDIFQRTPITWMLKLAILLTLSGNLSFFLSFWWICLSTVSYLNMQFHILSFKLKETINDSDTTDKRELIVNCIEYHCFILR